MLRLILKVFIVLFFYQLPALSKDYDEILIKGNERISDDTILVFADIPTEKFLDENLLDSILKKIYDSGFFNDVIVKINGGDLIIQVKENPIIQTLFINGIKTKKIKEKIDSIIVLKDRSSFNITLVRNDEVAILNLLKEMGYYFSTLTSSIEELKDNKVNLNYNIVLGDKAKISKISFLGDKIFKDRKLRNIIVSEEYKFWKIVSGGKFLNENLVNYDQRLLGNFYKNNGYFNVNIDASFANYLGNNEFELIYNISPGKKYFFNDLTLKLPDDYDTLNFKKLSSELSNLKGEKYSLDSIENILSEIDKIVLNEEFEFLKSTVSEEINDNLINLTFNIQESEKFYVERINIFGNSITREGVIRNNLFVDEGDAFNDLLHKKSINSLKSLNLFGDINSEILTGATDSQKIINITVDEKSTGEISAGAGVGTNGGSIGFGVKENNFLGRGIKFGTEFKISEESIRGLVSLNNPNYQGSNRSLNFSMESTVTDRLKNYGYKSNKTGFSIGSGFEYYDDLFLNTGISSYVEKLETDSSASANIKKQKGSYFDTFFNYTFSLDKRNQKFKASDGYKTMFTQNLPLLSETYTLTNTINHKVYNEWLNENIATFGFYASATNSLAGKNVKLSDRLFIPANRLRGFASGKAGPKDGNDHVGGNYLITFNAATTLPQIMPNLQNADFSIFFDAANIWGLDYDSTLGQDNRLRSSIGVAVDFYTPIGPLNFSLTEVISKDSKDTTESFRFNLGTTF
jgi:outer membrane protein insertion porin family